MLLEGKTPSIKLKWASALRGQPREDLEPSDQVLAEGLINKLQPIGSMNKLRWFVMTQKKFIYLREECGEAMAACDVEDVLLVAPRGKSVFVLRASNPFTVSGAAEVSCQCETEKVRDKWLTLMNRAMERGKVQV